MLSGLAKNGQIVCRIARSGRFKEVYGLKTVDPASVINTYAQSGFVNKQERKTFFRLLLMTIDAGGPRTMVAKVHHKDIVADLYLRFERFGHDLLIFARRD